MPNNQTENATDSNEQLFIDHINAAHVQRKQQKWNVAEQHFRAALVLRPQNPHARTFVAQMLYRQGFTDQAMEAFAAIIRDNPEFQLAYSFLGILHHIEKRPRKAIPLLEKAIKIGPPNANIHLNMGKSLAKIKHLNKAAKNFDSGLKFEPNNMELLQALGEVTNEMRDFETANYCFEKISQLAPNNAFAHSNFGLTLTSLKRLDEAWDANNKAKSLLPNHPIIQNNIGALLRYEDRIEESEQYLRNALISNPNHSGLAESLGLALLSKGELKEAFIHYDKRWQRKELKAQERNFGFSQSRWTGQPLQNKTLLIWPEQGNGDFLQFIRYVPLAIKQGAKVIVCCLPPMRRLVENMPGISQIINITEYKNGMVEYDYNCPVINLAIGFDTDIDTIPNNTPFIYTDNTTKEKWQKKISSNKLKVGIVWAGKSTHIFDRDRSMPFNTIAPLLNVSDVDFYSLQVPHDDALKGENVTDLACELSDYMETMGVIENLDLVISVDTSVAHLVGALNKPIWMLLSSAPSLMWLREREDSPWYPSMKIFRQSKQETWKPVVERVKQALSILREQKTLSK